MNDFRLFNTIKFLRPIQIYYRLCYLIRSGNFFNKKLLLFKSSNLNSLELIESIHIIDCYLGAREFKFLNLSKEFKKDIDWNYKRYGKLWTYNLTYFDFLSQNHKDSLCLIDDFIDNIDNIKDGLEPFPISLRGINWIKYLSYNNIINQKINDSLYAQYYILLDNLEYHLLGNHLLENGFSLLFGAYYFKDELLYEKAKKILNQQLEEQILEDGGHFELSPMYHQIMLFRLLDCINLVRNNLYKQQEILTFLINKAEIMLGWLINISYQNGDIPMFNDSSKNIAPTTYQLLDYAKRLEVGIKNIKLSDSGYRKVVKDNYELILDVGDIQASYIAGHTHADIFNFELRIDNKPFIIDMGITTYEICKRRDIERSTSSHNTVEIDNKNQSEVWGAFRVGNRAKIINLKEDNNFIEATHNGYKPILHTRKWYFEKDRILIEDELNQKVDSAIARLYFHHSVSKEYIFDNIQIDNNSWKLLECRLSNGFNSLISAKYIEIQFNKSLKVNISLLEFK